MTTIREHNQSRSNGITVKADYIVGVTLDGAFYCADCMANTPADPYPGPYGPTPVFATDDYDGMTCDDCFRCSNGLSPLACVAQCRHTNTEV